MSRMIRPFCAVGLALILSLTSVSMALARGNMAVHGTMVLCIGSVQVTVPIGSDGAPILQDHICPDCTIGPLATGSDAPHAIPILLTTQAVVVTHVQSTRPVPVQGAQARAPPAHSA
ncbi:hypothetical protein E2K80_10345 [Rhodophyticola sp. CCM32]|uniref:hypothetical protein n=1 Tax=Rhodophyticola sp. CCM32 TaxID=2916397 RepID=UPI00107F6860|nr:hypothetical protein [Rhodophyticola sp. CCM32]QBY01077.1 hypothetical protein E2K80_10345 [Rhodophyticola sp. CCM32]